MRNRVAASMIAAMEQRLTLHIVDGEMRSRAEQARTAFALGHHAEVYDDLDELLERPPAAGVIVLRQRSLDVTLDELFDRLGTFGLWLPVIVCAIEPDLPRVVSAIKQGALDYLRLPLDPTRLARSLATVLREARAHGAERRRLNYARGRIARLSRREREVLEWLADGSSNKVIARELEISPRTVEIHRANMMAKLDAKHAAEAVRLWLEARLESTIAPAALALPVRTEELADASAARPHGGEETTERDGLRRLARRS